MKKPTKKTPAKPADVVIDTDLVAAIARPLIERDRHLTVRQIGFILRAAYPQANWSAADLRKKISETFETVIDLPG